MGTQADRPVLPDLYPLSHQPRPLLPGMLRIQQVDLGAPRVALANHPMPSQPGWTRPHRTGSHAMAIGQASEFSQLSIGDDLATGNGPDDFVDGLESVHGHR